MRIHWKRIARAAIAIVVLIGLVIAARSALDQWRQQRDVAVQQLVEIDQAIDQAPSLQQREVLVAEREIVESRIPLLRNLNGWLIAAAAILYALGMIPGGIVLYEGARVCGYRVSVRDAIAAQVIGHLGKYVPGKAMVVVVRAGRLKQAGVPLVAGSLAVLLETLLMMASGAAVAGGLIFLLPVDRWIAWSALIGGTLASLPTLPPILMRVVGRLSKKTVVAPTFAAEAAEAGTTDVVDFVKDPSSTGSLARSTTKNSSLVVPAMLTRGQVFAPGQGWRFFCAAWLWQLVAWAFIGGSFCCLVNSLPGVDPDGAIELIYPASVASIALAMVVGFVSLLPGGAGIRELVLSVVLAPVIGGVQAMLAAILARLLFIAVELAAALVVTGMQRFVLLRRPAD